MRRKHTAISDVLCLDPSHEAGCSCSTPGHSLTRRDFVRLSSGLAVAAPLVGLTGASLLTGCARPKTAEPKLKIGYIPILDASPLLIGHAKGFFAEQGIEVDKPVLMRGWPELSEAFIAGTFNFVHLLLPLPIYMRYAQRRPVKVVAWNHMNGSAITVGMNSGIKRLEDIAGKQIAVPHWYSMHNVILQLCLREYDVEVVVQDRAIKLKPNQTNLFVMKPPDMPPAMASGAIDGYVVAEPFNAAGELLAKGTVVRFTGDVFKNHPCCVAAMNELDITAHPEWSQRVVNGLVKAQRWIIDNRSEAAQILSKDGGGYLPMQRPVIERAISKYDASTYGASGTNAIRHPEWGVSRIGFQPYPFESTTREVVRLLKETRVEGGAAFLASLDTELVVKDLFNYDMVRNAAAAAGGLQKFEGIDATNPFIRTELIDV